MDLSHQTKKAPRRGSAARNFLNNFARSKAIATPHITKNGSEDKAALLREDANPSTREIPTPTEQRTANVLATAQRFADDIAARPNRGETRAPIADLKRMGDLGLLTAPLPSAHGGLGLGTESGGHRALLRLLATIGGADLAIGRLYEGHVNALILISSFGTPDQIEGAARAAETGKLFGVWNTGVPDLLQIEGGPDTFHFLGRKSFASGAAFVERPIVTAELPGRTGWQMTLPRMEAPEISRAISIDRESWQPLGMEASESFGIDFTGASVTRNDLIGAPGDFYRDPLFRGGAIRFAAVQAGAILRLHRLFAEWLERAGRGSDPYQVARLGEIAIGAQEAVLWIERAAAVAEQGLSLSAEKLAHERMLECANMMRIAIERIATATMQRVIAGVGAHGLLQPHPFERILRDLTMYLRQPAPDQTLAEVGRASLRKTHLRGDGATNGFWMEAEAHASLPPTYFRNIYARSDDPWSFRTSKYEDAKYRVTLDSLPRDRYARAVEIGCSIGVLTERLAERCDDLLALDVSERALEQARQRCAHLPQVQFACMEVPQEIPEGAFDLIMISEVAYYWTRDDLERAAMLLAARQEQGGQLVLVHYTPHVPDYPLTGDQVHDFWQRRPEWNLLRHSRHELYRVDVLERCPD